jgi:hypothetical protein
MRARPRIGKTPVMMSAGMCGEKPAFQGFLSMITLSGTYKACESCDQTKS